MKSLKKQRRIQVIIITFISLALSTALIGYAMRDGINFFLSPSQVFENPPNKNEIFRLGGLIVTDGNASVPVEHNDVLPALINEGEGVIAIGTYADGKFLASKILAKHDENYMPKEVIDALKEQGVYKEVND